MKTILIAILAFNMSGCTAIIFGVAALPEIRRARAAEKAAFEKSGMTKKEWRNRPSLVRNEWFEDGRYWLYTYDDGSTRKEYDEEEELEQ